MAYVNNARASAPVIPEGINGVLKSVKAALERRAVYSRTVRELEALSDRELSDLGIARVSIRDIAAQAAYGY